MKLLALIIFFTININLLAQPVNPWTPPEYFPAKAVLIEWDFNSNTWPLYSELIYECQEVVDVILVVNNQHEENSIQNLLDNDNIPSHNIYFVHVPTERMWVRDHGPLSVMTDDGVVFMDLNDLADSGVSGDLPTNLANEWGLPSYELPYTFCGGNFMVNSHNTLFTTDRVYTNNPGIPEEEIQQDFYDYMGISEIITFTPKHNDYWGHIDMQLKLLNDSTAVISSVDPDAGNNYNILESNYQILANLPTPNGGTYTIEKILKAENWKTYANSLILNNKVIVPVYDNYRDTLALQTYQSLLPEHDIVGINANSIIGWGGAIHCITMQLFDESVITNIKESCFKKNPLQVYPNPLSENQKITFMFPDMEEKVIKLTITNALGKIIEEIPINYRKASVSFNWKYAPGTYFVTAIFEDNTFSSQTIITL